MDYQPIIEERFEKIYEGKKVGLFRLQNELGTICEITNYGAILVSFWIADRTGNFQDVVLGFDHIDDYIDRNDAYFGATIGRYANRIAGASFSLEGHQYQLDANDGSNHIHGGKKGFDKVVWDVKQINASSIELTYISKDGEEGYPGNLNVSLTYILTTDNALSITYNAISDKSTHINLTHHSYFNLNGVSNGNILDHTLMINADQVNEVDQFLIPTGKLLSVSGPLDFRIPKKIGAEISSNDPQMKFAGGYDHNYLLNLENEKPAVTVLGNISKRIMTVYTNEPAVQFYSSNWKDQKTIGKSGVIYERNAAFCLESQHFPNSPNQLSFPTTILRPGEHYHSWCKYKFS